MKAYQLDQTDFALLNLLQQDGLMTYKELSGKTRKSMTNVAERVRNLKEMGYISSTVALVDLKKIRTLFVAFPHVQLISHAEDVLRKFQNEVTQFPEVLECYHLTGHYDYMLKIAMPDMVSFNAFIREKLGALENVGSVESFLVLSQTKHSTAYHL
ncbi:Lrp/AsnC family transcriptional regulator [Pedobacter miscanthi]|uniref:AsnC family transcriptional regulator n=1 Tax=Pedobacter miscanthi TaxID=2259170 RepID=A0A366L1U7_9SPHI|nr:Lrp/AsnC family transcriptional regulator [Pedobacter miscanthi]RBQ07855.1 AsnC family transcriptional regulator [Pedobacter miscanthi]